MLGAADRLHYAMDHHVIAASLLQQDLWPTGWCGISFSGCQVQKVHEGRSSRFAAEACEHQCSVWVAVVAGDSYCYPSLLNPSSVLRLLQVLLQLNIAYYLPSIPILLLAGHFEKLLDEQFGTTTSMAVRLTVGKCLLQQARLFMIDAALAVQDSLRPKSSCSGNQPSSKLTS